MKIWYDACTGKQIRYGAAIKRRLEDRGYKVILTTRKHPDTIPLAEYLGIDFKVVGKYNTRTLYTRLYESLRRQIIFSKMFRTDPPKCAICHSSVDLSRVAFGLRIPIICTFDTPHADAVNRLTIPLASIVIAPKAIPEEIILRYGARSVFQFDGVDEVVWMRDFKPTMEFDFRRPLIVVRQSEVRSVYAEGGADIMEDIARKLTSLGQVVYLSRYERKRKRGIIVPKSFIDSVSLVSQADLVVSAGGTIAREAALSGVPSIVINIFGKIHVNDYLAKKGFPIFTIETNETMEYAKKYIGRRFDVKHLLNELENPLDVIEDVVRRFTH